MKYEYCCKCDCATGNAGAGDDSLYTETDGPFCEDCFPEFKSKQKQDELMAKAWEEGYRMGVADERTSESNIGIAGFRAKVEPNRQNPYGTQKPKQEQDEPESGFFSREAMAEHSDGHVHLKQEQDEPVTTDWERIARVQNAKLMAMSDTVGGFEKLCEVLDKYEATTPQQCKPLTIEQIGDFWLDRFDKEGSPIENFARAIEAAHGIKE